MDDTDRAILELEDRFRRRASANENAIREIGLAGTSFSARLNRLIDDPLALVEFPRLIADLRSSREVAQQLLRRTG